eukprot:726233-Alexandrium_andersonii.AAC.1
MNRSLAASTARVAVSPAPGARWGGPRGPLAAWPPPRQPLRPRRTTALRARGGRRSRPRARP